MSRSVTLFVQVMSDLPDFPIVYPVIFSRDGVDRHYVDVLREAGLDRIVCTLVAASKFFLERGSARWIIVTASDEMGRRCTDGSDRGPSTGFVHVACDPQWPECLQWVWVDSTFFCPVFVSI